MPEGYIMGVEVWLHSLILDGSESSGSCLSPLIQEREPTVPIDYEAGWDPRDVLDVMEKRENQYLAPVRNRTLHLPAHSLWTIMHMLSQLQSSAS